MEREIELVNCRGIGDPGLIGKLFQGRYLVKMMIQRKIFKIEDIKDGNKQYWMKIGDSADIAHEIDVLYDLNSKSNQNTT